MFDSLKKIIQLFFFWSISTTNLVDEYTLHLLSRSNVNRHSSNQRDVYTKITTVQIYESILSSKRLLQFGPGYFLHPRIYFLIIYLI